MSALKDRATAYLDRARVRSRLLDHAINTQQHYSSVKGSYRAGAVTYYAFLSFFPILAIAFFVVGSVASVFPDAQDNLVTALESVLPGLIGNGPEALKWVSMVGNDLRLDEGIGTCGKEGQSVPVGVGIPTIKIDRMTVGGTA